jgi:dihydroflavonol-4-reductase
MIDLSGKTIAVTGATGFIGRYVVDALLERGAHVVGVVRSPGRVPSLAARGVEMRRADLADRASLAEGFRGAWAVVSNAALFSLQKSGWDEHINTNVEGTRNVIEAAATAGAHRVVHVSSVAVYKSLLGRPVREDHPQLSLASPRRGRAAYGISKALSEQLAWRLAAERGLDLTCVRPCAVYGAFDPNFTPLLRKLLAFPVNIVPAFCRFPLVYAGDVAESVALCLERPASTGKSYNVTGGDFTLRQLRAALRDAGGRVGPISLPLPLPLLVSFDHSLAARDLGWVNRSYGDAFRDTLRREREEAGG